ncbi:hypothetical protein OOU_Y34scaffold00793g25 [Pyricularia oryzae Y34]|uniref:Uncharacterized protein n=2 Tax=Pyricularia oryzae TaxID=318829 RepID=A0AA97NQ36_PYRO3|nr:hypothetical protein OOU_Y34scaffold00793g25 [Pyricularia oryzae Y34]
MPQTTSAFSAAGLPVLSGAFLG